MFLLGVLGPVQPPNKRIIRARREEALYEVSPAVFDLPVGELVLLEGIIISSGELWLTLASSLTLSKWPSVLGTEKTLQKTYCGTLWVDVKGALVAKRSYLINE